MRPSPVRPTLSMLVCLLIAFCAVARPAASAEQSPVVHHNLAGTLDPANHRLKVRDRIHVPGALVTAPFTISLNGDLRVQAASGGLKLFPVRPRVPGSQSGIDRDDHDPASRVPVNVYGVEGAIPGQELSGELNYEGVINYTARQSGGEYARAFNESPGLIEERGVYLAGSTSWVPRVGDALITYTLAVDLPAGWKSVSQGERISSGAPDRWSVATPTEEVHLIAAPFTEYSRDAGAVKAFAFLRKPDPALADRYLDATAQYLEMYRGLLGPYPYSKFALVENFWETGYGMPSFTLLGEQVIRFPFILHSSYPHELLHNWWGNGVFVDSAGGNWCEGLTAYLADHLIAEQRGQGAEHRRAILQRVTDYVTPENDFPLTRFQSRYNAVTEAVGYGKTAMVFNMLREKVGDAQFTKALQQFYRDNRFRPASFDDIRKSFEAVSGLDLRSYFDQWVKDVGTPELKLEEAVAQGARLTVTLSQVQAGRPFALDVPVVIETNQGVETKTLSMPADKARVEASFDLKGPARRVEIDPQFQLYRRLSPLEIPPSLSKALGAKEVLIVLSAQSASRYAGLAKAWARDGVETVMDSEINTLPSDRAVWLFGERNKFAPVVADALKPYGASLDAAGLRTSSTAHDAAGRSLIAVARNLTPQAQPIKLTPRKALAEIKPLFDTGRMKADIDWLAAPEREGRGAGSRGLDAAARYVAERFERLGLVPLSASAPSDDRYFQPFTMTG